MSKAFNKLNVQAPTVRSGDAPPKGSRIQKWRPIYNAMARLKPGERFVWEHAPVHKLYLFRRWKKQLERTDIEMYKGLNGETVIRSRAEDDFLEEDDQSETQTSDFAGGDDDEELEDEE